MFARRRWSASREHDARNTVDLHVDFCVFTHNILPHQYQTPHINIPRRILPMHFNAWLPPLQISLHISLA